ncbi:hypothetical protein [Aquihabitans sp. McL0605]|uniref:hypothetical protein n=1 Tax=Aquihabitans sp. McL0605 TaxID=3415671 RepID=UPI003CF11AAC
MGRSRCRRAAPAAAIAGVLVLLLAACQPPEPWTKVTITGFTPAAHHVLNSITQDQGVATVYRTSPTTGKPTLSLVYGGEVIDKAFSDDGWTHVGDPDSLRGFVVYPYQASDFTAGKMFRVVTPNHRSFRYTHALDGGEEGNNSFASISPDGQWLVSGEWDTEGRLLVFPMPILNPSVPSGDRPLALAAQISLSTPLDQVQGCDFQTPTSLLCSVDDAQKRLVRITLPAALDGTDTTGTVTQLGKLPLFSTCQHGFEAEGVDFDPVTNLLRVAVIPPPPCFLHTDQYTYKLKP